MPKGSSPERLANIRALGADASVTDLNYDDTVRLVQQQAQEQGWVVIQDTAWEGYWDIPAWIMEGYTTMALEAVRQLEDRPPTHLFLQAGVGAMAGSLAAFFADFYGQDRPKVVIVEPHRPTVCSIRPRPMTASSIAWMGRWTRSWPVWPVESPALSPGISCGTTRTIFSLFQTMWPLRECGCWALPCPAIPRSSPVKAVPPPSVL